MEFDRVVRIRKSVRKFKDKSVSFRDFLSAIDLANHGPFPQNHNHLKYLIVENKDKKKEIASICEQDWISSAPVLIVVCSDDVHLEKIYDLRGRIYSRQTAGAAIYAMMLKLADLGIGSCWVGSYSDKELRKSLSIPDGVQIEAVVPIGFSEDITRKPTKKSLDNSLFWEKWGMARRPSAFEESLEDYKGR